MKWSACNINKVLQRWYIPLIAGLFNVAVSIAFFSLPQLSISAVMLFFSVTLIGFGLRECLFIYANKGLIKHWGILMVFASFITVSGLVLMFSPLWNIAFLQTLIMFLLIGKAIQNFIFHFRYNRKTESTSGMNWIYNVALIMIALVIFLHPKIMSSILVTISGLPFLILGICFIIFSMILRRSNKKLEAFKASFKAKDIDYELVD